MILGIDISSRAVAVILAHDDGRAELALRTALPRDSSAPAVWQTAMETARATLERADLEPHQVARAGLAFDGSVDERGVVRKTPRSMGWDGFDLALATTQQLGVAAVVVDSRVTCGALGEWRFGALRPADAASSDWLYVHIGATVGGAATVNGQLVRGATRTALDIGALCIERDGVLCATGRRGCLEGYCATDGFMARAAGYGLTLKTPLEVWNLIGTNFGARSLCDDYAARLAQGLGNAVVLLNPGCLVLGGELVQELGDKLLVPVRTRLRDFGLPSHFEHLWVQAASLGADAAVMGAIALVMDRA